MRHRLLVPLLSLGLLLPPLASAETLSIGDTRQEAARAGVKMPKNGMTMKKVEMWFGEPLKRYPAVGDPPITRWEYANYMVYFEYDRVITSVWKRKR